MREKEQINKLKLEATARAEMLGHRLRPFDKYKDPELYLSAFCARCSAYVLVTAFCYSGRAVEEQCQRLCLCRQPLTPEDLDGYCEGCRGNRLTLYLKTPAIKAKEANYRKKRSPEYEPSIEESSAYFWRCQHCFRRLGPGYQGDPDERGYCSACIESEKAQAKREAELIEAAGGLRAWRRRRLIGKTLAPLDFAAMFIVIIAAAITSTTLILLIIQSILTATGHFLKTLMPVDKSGGIVLGIIVAALGWCALRWKALNRRPSDKP